MARPLSTSRALSPTLSGPQLAAVVNEVAASSPIAEVAVAQACKRQSDGIVRTRSGCLYATGRIASAGGAGSFAAGSTVDIFNVPIGQVGSGFGAPGLSKAQTSMTQAGLLASEAFSVDKIGFNVTLSEVDGAEPADDVAAYIQWLYNNTVAELHLGGQDVQLLGTLGQYPDTLSPTSISLSAAANSAFQNGTQQSGFHAMRDFELFIPQQVPFKVKLTIPIASNFTGAVIAAAANFDVKCTMYGTSVTAIQA